MRITNNFCQHHKINKKLGLNNTAPATIVCTMDFIFFIHIYYVLVCISLG